MHRAPFAAPQNRPEPGASFRRRKRPSPGEVHRSADRRLQETLTWGKMGPIRCRGVPAWLAGHSDPIVSAREFLSSQIVIPITSGGSHSATTQCWLE